MECHKKQKNFFIRKLSIGVCSVAMGLILSLNTPMKANASNVGDAISISEIEPVSTLNLLSNPSFENNDYVSNKPNAVYPRVRDLSVYAGNENGNNFFKSKDNSANDFLLFEANTVKGRTYTAIADIKIDVAEGYTASGAFFDVKNVSSDGSQKTLAGGKNVSALSASIGKWERQEIQFTAESNKTFVGLVKWNDNQSDPNTLNTSIKIDNLKIYENTDYHEVWKDEFNGTKLDDSKWGYELGNIRGNEQQHYSSSKENVDVVDGKLVIKATNRPAEDQYYNRQKHGDRARLVHYNSGSVRTVGKQEFLYGRIEAKIKLPKGKAVFPAFWTLGADFNLDGRIESGQGYGWPSTGEIDIMELIGSVSGTGNRRVYGTPHFYYINGDADKDGNSGSGYSGNLTINKDFSDDYHVFGINWSEDRIEWYVDDVIYNTLVYDNSERSQALKLGFNRPQYIQFNLATGGNWPGNAGLNLAGQTVEVDWVRWLQSDEQKASMEKYYASKPVISGVRNFTIVEGTTPDLLEGVTINSEDYKVEYSIEDEYMFVNTGAEGGRNEVSNVVENSTKADKIASLKPGIYNIYYTSIPKAEDYSGRTAPVYKMTRELSQLIILPEQLNGKVGEKLSSVNLPDGWTWSNPEEIISEKTSYDINFVNVNDPIDSNNRRMFETTIDINVKKEVNKTELETLVSKASEIKLSDYTKVTTDVLTENLNKAKEVLNNENATQEEVDLALTNLNNAMDKLEKLPVINGWKLVDGIARYYIDGEYVKGLKLIGKTTYLFNSNGEKQFGWHLVNGKAYYFSPEHGGGMLTGMRKIGQTVYILTSEGKKTGWHKINGKEYYFSPEHGGGMLTGMRKIGKTTYLLTSEGKKTGWHRINGKNYYFSPEHGGLINR